jgi:methyltransferase-like protein/2-polyprenyl-3-methyl-5-hydroxy-6-metoxy-1,4-benzoquinol methylase
MKPCADTATSYDQIPYTSFPIFHSHPRNLAAVAKLFGLQVAALDHARVLEIGCSTGGNLIPLACQFPNSEFIGIDASSRQIAIAKGEADELGLKNAHFHVCDVLDYNNTNEPFDYIICHGVYSWVAANVQDRILSLCRENLAPTGVCYISYNTYPGWFLRQGIREMMRYHAGSFTSETEKIEQSRALLNFLSCASSGEASTYQRLLIDELEVIRACDDSYLYHEHLEACNEPIYFHEFVSRSQSHGLKFLGESQVSSMFPNEFHEDIRTTLQLIANDLIQYEQYLDFLRNRRFRQSLLVHKELQPNRVLNPESVLGLIVSAEIKRSFCPDESGSKHEIAFEHANGKTITVPKGLVSDAFDTLASIWPREISFDELWESAQKRSDLTRSSTSPCKSEFAGVILNCYSQGLVELFAMSQSNRYRSAAISAPRTTRWIQRQAALGFIVTNLRHQSVKIGQFEKEILQLVDGELSLIELTSRISNGPKADEIANSVEFQGFNSDWQSFAQVSFEKLQKASLFCS